ncbi:MAG: DUF4249 domain-containing protein [Cyclobacteriaceae bacterium]
MLSGKIYFAHSSALCLLPALLFLACTQELDIPFPQGKEQLVLNSILHPDSTIKISLTKTLPLGNTGSDFPVVDNAEIRLYEDDVLIGSPTFQDSLHVLNYFPKAGKQYSIEVIVPGFSTLNAADQMPQDFESTVCIAPDERYVFNNASIYITIEDPTKDVNSYWLYTTSYHIRDKEGCFDPFDEDCYELYYGNDGYYYSFSSVPDRFNAYIDNVAGGVTSYDYFVRVEDSGVDGEAIIFEIASNISNNYISSPDVLPRKLHIISASQHYDRFLKSSVLYVLNHSNYSYDEDFAFTPFAEIIQTYSNIENGTGIFAAYNSVSIPYDNFRCE